MLDKLSFCSARLTSKSTLASTLYLKTITLIRLSSALRSNTRESIGLDPLLLIERSDTLTHEMVHVYTIAIFSLIIYSSNRSTRAWNTLPGESQGDLGAELWPSEKRA